MNDLEIDRMLREAAPAAACHEPQPGLARSSIARARAAQQMQRVRRLRMLQQISALAAAVLIGLVLWIGSSRLQAAGQADITSSLTSTNATTTSTTTDQSPYASLLLGLLIAGVAFAGWRSFERPPADLSPLWRFG